MLFSQVEREMTKDQPWVISSINWIEQDSEVRDCWEIKTKRHQYCTPRFWMSNKRFWRNFAFTKRILQH